MAPRVVVRQPPAAAPALEAAPAARTVQRAWQVARPGAETPVLPRNGLSGHRRGTTDNVEEHPPRPLRTAPPLPGAAGNGGGSFAPGELGASMQTGPGGVDVDRLIEAIEERVLAEIERRGGRYTGLF